MVEGLSVVCTARAKAVAGSGRGGVIEGLSVVRTARAGAVAGSGGGNNHLEKVWFALPGRTICERMV